MSCEAEDILIEKYFEIFDKDGNGTLTGAELKKIVQVLFKGDRDAELLMKKFDENDSDSLELDEFKKLYQSFNMKPKGQSLLKMFSCYDKNGDNSLSAEEVRSFLNDLDPDKQVSDKDLERLMRETDVNNDGSVNFGEFCRMYVLLESNQRS